MSNHRPGMKGWVKSHIGRNGGQSFLIGAKDLLDTVQHKYEGPTAEISFDETWLHIETDPHEGHVMLNIETLPYLRRALAKIARKIGDKP